MRRWLGNKLINLAYRIKPELKVELNQYVQYLLDEQARLAAYEATRQLLAHQQQAARIAALQ